MSVRVLIVAGLAGAAAAGLVACQSSQDKSAELAKHAQTAISGEKEFKITEKSSVVKVLDTAVLSDKNGAAAVVTLRNDSSQTLQNVPILIHVLNGKGKTVFSNDAPGSEKTLQNVPIMQPGQTVDWVDDQVFATDPESVKVEVGQVGPNDLPPQLPQLDVSPAKVINDPVSGLEATGTITNESQIEQHDLTLFSVARVGNKIVAAGRAGVRKVRVGSKAAHYHVYFIGDPTGAKVSVWAPPTVFN